MDSSNKTDKIDNLIQDCRGIVLKPKPVRLFHQHFHACKAIPSETERNWARSVQRNASMRSSACMAVLMVLSFRQSFFAHIVIHVTLSRVTLALLGSVFQTERFVESISKPSISFNHYCDCLAFLLKDEINFILLKSGAKFTQRCT